MAKKKKGLSKTERLRKNIKATIRRREAQGWQFDPLDLATVESGNYQQLKSLQRDNYRKLYEHATVTNPENGQTITGRQAQIRGRWKGGMWQDQMSEPELPEPEEPESGYDWTEDWEPEDEEDQDDWDPALDYGELVFNNLKKLYEIPGVKYALVTELENLIEDCKERNGVYKTLRRAGQNAGRLNRLFQLYVMYYDPETGEQNTPGDPMILQEIRQILDPNVTLDDLDAYSQTEDIW